VSKADRASTPNMSSAKNNGSKKATGPASIHSKLFLAGKMLAASCMILLPILYAVLILFVLNMTISHFEDNISFVNDHSFIVGLLLYFIPGFIGIFLVAAMAKLLIARPGEKKFFIPLSRKNEPAFQAFIEKVCHAVGSKIPDTIEVDCSIHASANYRRGIISFLEDDLTLTIGLPIISEMTMTEFANVLAHELSQYTKKTETRLSSIITGINLWFARVIYEQDVIDDKFALLSLTASGFLTQIPLNIAKFFIWLSRKILTVFMIAGHMISKYFVRQIEFDADESAVSLTGFESFKSSLTKLHTLMNASFEAFSQLKTQRDPNDNSLPNDFVFLISSINRQVSDKGNLKPKQNSLQGKTAIRTIYPSDQERIDHGMKIASKDIFQSDKPVSALFTNFEELCKIASMRLYREVLDIRFDKDDLVPASQFNNSSGLTSNTADSNSNFF
jgi:Zn-dependent protease with chaperone function